MTERVVVITGATALPRPALDLLPSDALVIAVDGGLDHARAAGIEPHVLVGDLDSVSADGLAWATAHIEVIEHPRDKDRTDTQLALDEARARGAATVTVIGGGDRLDHTLAAIGALADPTLSTLERLHGWWDDQRFEILHAPRRHALDGPPGSTVSVVALRDEATVSIAGVRWPLDHHRLIPLDGLGVSNEVADSAVVDAHDGVVVVFDTAPDLHGRQRAVTPDGAPGAPPSSTPHPQEDLTP